jgi:hypothetical protein
LADRLGTLDDTIDEAKRLAGMKPKSRVRIVEYPKRPLLRLPGFLSVPGSSAAPTLQDSPAPGFPLEARSLQSVLDRPGRPLLLVPGTLLPDEPEPVR